MKNKVWKVVEKTTKKLKECPLTEIESTTVDVNRQNKLRELNAIIKKIAERCGVDLTKS